MRERAAYTASNQVNFSGGTELKDWVEKFDFLTKAIDTEASLPFDQAWSRASKKVGPSVSIDQEPEKCESEVVEIVSLRWPPYGNWGRF